MDAILGQTTAHGRRQKLRTMTEGLDLKDFYGATIDRIKKQGGERARLGMAALMWISHSERLLQRDELLHALAVEIGSTDLNAENIPSVETLLSCCLGLLVVDRRASSIRLIHFSLQEYLDTCPDIFGPTHSIMAETCLTYLNFQTTKHILSIPRDSFWRFDLPSSTPFLKYSSLYWGIHARREASKGVISLALQLFSQIETHISIKLLLEDVRPRGAPYDILADGPLTGFAGLHCASIFGIAEIATSFMNQPNCNPNKRDCLGATPLIWAAICGQEEIVKLLLERQTISLDKPDRYARRTALSWAAKMGNEGVVRQLLERASAKPDGTDGWWGRTPRVVKKVRGKRYIDPNRGDKYGKTPILLAAEEGHEGVVKLLLGRKDVNPHIFGMFRVNPNICYDENKPDRVMWLAYEWEKVYGNMRNKNGLILLRFAIKGRHNKVVELLLGREDISPNMADNRGRTPLSWAAEYWSYEVVELLLGRGDVSPNMPDNDGRTPLSWAAEYGSEAVVKLLLGRGDVNPDMQDNRGRTPLSWAASGCYLGGSNSEVVKLLLESEDVNPNMPDNDGRTPLSWAAKDRNDRVVRLLLEREAGFRMVCGRLDGTS